MKTRMMDLTRPPPVRLTCRDATLRVWVAREPEELSQGLSGFRSLPRNTGMLFVLPEGEPARFWMRGVPFPLDIAFLDAKMRVLSVHRMAAETGEARGAARYAVEAPAGWFTRNGIRAGDLMAREQGMYKYAKEDSTLRKALPVAGAMALPLLMKRAPRFAVPLAGLGSVMLSREDASLPFLAPVLGAWAGSRLGASVFRKALAARYVRKGVDPAVAQLLAKQYRAPQFMESAAKRPLSPVGVAMWTPTLLGAGLGAHLGNK